MPSLASCLFPIIRVPSQASNILSLQRGNVYCAEDAHVGRVLDTLFSSVTPSPLRRLDQTEHHFSHAADAD